LDSHTLLWWFTGDPLLPKTAKWLITEAEEPVFVSAASAWEIAIKLNLGRLPSSAGLLSNFDHELQLDSFESLPITAQHGIRAGLLPGPDKDPFDRMLIAQAQAENLGVVSNDKVFDRYGVRRLW
jgi:PIN domain nuclease of toxin-antitoxin system